MALLATQSADAGTIGYNAFAIAQAEREAATSLCTTETEAHEWRLRCLQAEAQLRLLKQRRRGDRHPSWPAHLTALERLQNRCVDLHTDAKSREASSLRPLRSFFVARMAGVQLQHQLVNEEEEARQLERAKSFEEQIMSEMTLKQHAEEKAICQGQEELSAERDEAEKAVKFTRRLREELRARQDELGVLGVRRDEVIGEATLIHRDCSRLELEVEDDQPHQLRLAEDTSRVVAECERARGAAKRRADAVTRLAQEISENATNDGLQTLREQEEVENNRSEVRELSASMVELDDQFRRARVGHSQQIKAVREGGVALRNALADSEIEYDEIVVVVQRARAVVDALMPDHEVLQARKNLLVNMAESYHQETRDYSDEFSAHEESREIVDAAWRETELQMQALVTECTEYGTEERRVATESMAAKAALSEMRGELGEMYREFSADACTRREERIVACHSECMTLEERGAELADICGHLRGNDTKRQQMQRERQLVTRRAAMEAAVKLKVGYADMMKEIRGGGASGPGTRRGSITSDAGTVTKRSSIASDASAMNKRGSVSFDAGVANKSARRIGRQIDDLLSFAETSCEVPQFGDANVLLNSVQESRLPESVTDAFLAVHEVSASGSRQYEELAKEKDKYVDLRRKLQNMLTSHSEEVERLSNVSSEITSELQQCEEQLEVERTSVMQDRKSLEAQLLDAGVRQTEAQMGAVTEIQQQSQVHSAEVAKLRQKRSELQLRRWRSAVEPTNGGDVGVGREQAAIDALSELQASPSLPMSRRLKLKELEVGELRERVATIAAKHEELNTEVSGREVATKFARELNSELQTAEATQDVAAAIGGSAAAAADSSRKCLVQHDSLTGLSASLQCADNGGSFTADTIHNSKLSSSPCAPPAAAVVAAAAVAAASVAAQKSKEIHRPSTTASTGEQADESIRSPRSDKRNVMERTREGKRVFHDVDEATGGSASASAGGVRLEAVSAAWIENKLEPAAQVQQQNLASSKVCQDHLHGGSHGGSVESQISAERQRQQAYNDVAQLQTGGRSSCASGSSIAKDVRMEARRASSLPPTRVVANSSQTPTVFAAAVAIEALGPSAAEGGVLLPPSTRPAAITKAGTMPISAMATVATPVAEVFVDSCGVSPVEISAEESLELGTSIESGGRARSSVGAGPTPRALSSDLALIPSRDEQIAMSSPSSQQALAASPNISSNQHRLVHGGQLCSLSSWCDDSKRTRSRSAERLREDSKAERSVPLARASDAASSVVVPPQPSPLAPPLPAMERQPVQSQRKVDQQSIRQGSAALAAAAVAAAVGATKSVPETAELLQQRTAQTVQRPLPAPSWHPPPPTRSGMGFNMRTKTDRASFGFATASQPSSGSTQLPRVATAVTTTTSRQPGSPRLISGSGAYSPPPPGPLSPQFTKPYVPVPLVENIRAVSPAQSPRHPSPARVVSCRATALGSPRSVSPSQRQSSLSPAPRRGLADGRMMWAAVSRSPPVVGFREPSSRSCSPCSPRSGVVRVHSPSSPQCPLVSWHAINNEAMSPSRQRGGVVIVHQPVLAVAAPVPCGQIVGTQLSLATSPLGEPKFVKSKKSKLGCLGKQRPRFPTFCTSNSSDSDSSSS